MSKLIKAKKIQEIVEMERLINNAAMKSPELWEIIERSVSIAELTANSIQTNSMKGISISSDANIDSFSQVKEL